MQSLYFFKFIFIYFLFLAALGLHCSAGLSLVAESGGYSSLRCAGFSLRWLLQLQSTGSRRRGFSSCGARAQLLRSMWDLPGPGLEPMSPASAGGFLTTAPPGKSHAVPLDLVCGKVLYLMALCTLNSIDNIQ